MLSHIHFETNTIEEKQIFGNINEVGKTILCTRGIHDN